MVKFRFVFVSKDESFRLSREMTAPISESSPDVEFDYVANNTQPLAVVYNTFLNGDDIADYTLLMHSDVKLDVNELMKHIESVAGKYDVMGLCGCAKFSVSQSPLNWWNGSRPFPEERWGCVSHGELGNQQSFFSNHSPDVTDHEVACIDGLCIIISKKAIEAGLRFDETLSPFDFYDTDISMQAVLKHKLKLGVIVRKDLEHYSLGRGILNPQFLESEKKFREKWHLEKDTSLSK